MQTVCWKTMTDTEYNDYMNPVVEESMFSANNMDWLWTSSEDTNIDMTNFENLEVPRSSHCMVSFDGVIYAVGGAGNKFGKLASRFTAAA